MDRFLTIFMYVWASIIISLDLLGIGFTFYSKGFWEGFHYCQDVYSPFNIVSWLFIVVSLLPAIGAFFWREKRRETEKKNASSF